MQPRESVVVHVCVQKAWSVGECTRQYEGRGCGLQGGAQAGKQTPGAPTGKTRGRKDKPKNRRERFSLPSLPAPLPGPEPVEGGRGKEAADRVWVNRHPHTGGRAPGPGFPGVYTSRHADYKWLPWASIHGAARASQGCMHIRAHVRAG